MWIITPVLYNHSFATSKFQVWALAIVGHLVPNLVIKSDSDYDYFLGFLLDPHNFLVRFMLLILIWPPLATFSYSLHLKIHTLHPYASDDMYILCKCFIKTVDLIH